MATTAFKCPCTKTDEKVDSDDHSLILVDHGADSGHVALSVDDGKGRAESFTLIVNKQYLPALASWALWAYLEQGRDDDDQDVACSMLHVMRNRMRESGKPMPDIDVMLDVLECARRKGAVR